MYEISSIMAAILFFMKRMAATMFPTSLSSSARSKSVWRFPSASSVIWSETLIIGFKSSSCENLIVFRHCNASLINPARNAAAQIICTIRSMFLEESRRPCILVMTSSVRELICWMVLAYSSPNTNSVADATSPASTDAMASSSSGTRLSESAAIFLSSSHS